jgi:hypothetical protein
LNVLDVRGWGKGILCSEEKTFTLSTVDNMRICMEDKVSVIEMGALARGQGNRVWNDNCPTPRAEMGDNQPCVLMDQGGGVMNVEYNKTGTLRRETHGHEPIIQHNTVVRRLTPVECERLQGFPDNYTNIPWANKPTAPDSRRYKALGNSMAVPVMRWIGKRMMDAKEVVYDAEAIRKVMLPSLSHDEIKTWQQMLFYELS